MKFGSIENRQAWQPETFTFNARLKVFQAQANEANARLHLSRAALAFEADDLGAQMTQSYLAGVHIGQAIRLRMEANKLEWYAKFSFD